LDIITYTELSDGVNAVAAALTQQPARPGDRVAILGFRSIDYSSASITPVLKPYSPGWGTDELYAPAAAHDIALRLGYRDAFPANDSRLRLAVDISDSRSPMRHRRGGHGAHSQRLT
jgi:hypothetical protein